MLPGMEQAKELHSAGAPSHKAITILTFSSLTKKAQENLKIILRGSCLWPWKPLWGFLHKRFQPDLLSAFIWKGNYFNHIACCQLLWVWIGWSEGPQCKLVSWEVLQAEFLQWTSEQLEKKMLFEINCAATGFEAWKLQKVAIKNIFNQKNQNMNFVEII